MTKCSLALPQTASLPAKCLPHEMRPRPGGENALTTARSLTTLSCAPRLSCLCSMTSLPRALQIVAAGLRLTIGQTPGYGHQMREKK